MQDVSLALGKTLMQFYWPWPSLFTPLPWFLPTILGYVHDS